MKSPTHALLWEMWRLNRQMIAAIVGLTVAGRLVDFFGQAVETGSGSAEMSPMVFLLLMIAFLLLFGVFNYTEASDNRGVGGFPSRLFILPVSSLRLVTIPVLAGIASVELLYLAWMEPLSRASSTSAAFVAALLASLMVFYQAGLWTLDRLGPVRMLVVGAVALVLLGIGVSPSFPPSPLPAWRSESALAAMVVSAAVIAFLLALRRVRSLRCGGTGRVRRLDRLIASAAAVMPARRKAFASPAAAHFWFEWRCSGLALPMLVGGVLLIVIGPLSWIERDEARRTVPLLFGALATPMVLAIPIGFGFGKPTFWSEDLSLPAFLAVRPLTDDDITAIKVKVAIASVAASWLLVLLFAGSWLSMWANLDAFSRFAAELRAFPGTSMAAVFGVAVSGVLAGMFLTWRFMVNRLWTGLSGSRRLFSASVMSVLLMGIVGVFFVAAGLPGWAVGRVAEDPGRMAAVGWMALTAVGVKFGLAAYAWRRVSARYVRQYFLVWAGGTVCFVTLAFLLCEVARGYGAPDIYRFQKFMILLALLAMPLGRLGLTPTFLARNRHR
jgi:hypothetical protein